MEMEKIIDFGVNFGRGPLSHLLYDPPVYRLDY